MTMAHLYCGGAECLDVSVSDLLEVRKTWIDSTVLFKCISVIKFELALSSQL